MKKVSMMLLAGVFAATASANLNGDGYYRVQNSKTERYIYVLDNKGKLNMQATTADLGALELWKNYDKTISDPATVVYVQDLTGKSQDFDLLAQGTGVYSIITHAVSIRLDQKYFPNSYTIFGRDSGVTRYIGDATRSDADRGYVAQLDNNEYYRWYFHPVTTDDSNYFGISADLTDGTTNYAAFYADFPFSFHSDGMKAYKVYCVQDGKAYIEEIEGVVPRSTPVIITASSPSASDNRLTLGGTPDATVDDNLLQGVYFENYSKTHNNLTPYDAATMRVLGTLSDGSVGFKVAELENVPRNQAYLVVPEGTPDELPLSTDEPAGIADVSMSPAMVSVQGLSLYVSGVKTADVYSVAGVHVGHIADAQNGKTVTLPGAGVYVVKAGDTVRKVFAK
ncbi:MAG: hypothetical protein K2M12_01605 [Muribaculaceae bacterium]|nr:hypothetical protein [Muribaculaceae bacterium]